jgi:ABC-type bacteriocin/lantibiotic exporter with double-glycine peptidase domain
MLFLLGSLSSLAFPYGLKLIIDDVLPNKNVSALLTIGGLLFAASLLKVFSNYFSNILFSRLSSSIVSDIRIKLFTHILYQPRSFFDNQKIGDLLQKIDSEIYKIEDVLSGSIIVLINNSILLISLIVVLSWLNIKLFVISIVFIPLLLWITRKLSSKITSSYRAISDNESDLKHFFAERFEKITLIKSLNSYLTEIDVLRGLTKSWIKENILNTKYSSLHSGWTNLLITISLILVLCIGGYQIVIGSLTAGALMAFIQYLNRIYQPALDTVNIYGELLKSKVSLDKIYEILDNPNILQMESHSIKLSEKIHKVIFKDVEFGYNNYPIIKSLSYSFFAGKRYAIVGKTGSGKSTILKLIAKQYTPQKGQILLNSYDLSAISTLSVLEKVGYLSQETYLFNKTVKENILHGLPDAHQRLESIALKYDIKDILSQKSKAVGDNGIQLSGGQRQRINLARFTLRNFDIIIIDEATSALDVQSETKFLQNLFTDYPEAIIIIVTHRLNPIQMVDEVILIDEGRIVTSGDYNEVIKNSLGYNDLFRELKNESLKRYNYETN